MWVLMQQNVLSQRLEKKMVPKLKRIGILRHEDGWNGGLWKLNGETFEPHHLPKKFFLKIKGKYIEACLIKRRGHDYDHGHEYEWINHDFELKVKSEIGILKLSLLESVSSRVIVTVYQGE